MTQPSQTVARAEKPSAYDLMKKHQGTFTGVLPSHVDPKQWLNQTFGILQANPTIAEAAVNDPGRFLFAVLEAARRGLEPGTEQFYLVPYAPKKGAPRVINGIIGYQGEIELIYRAGAVSSIIVELVYTNDGFEFSPGQMDRPKHTIDWTKPNRGDLMLVYAYAIMKDGATSKVVVLNATDIARAKQSSASAGSEYGPWTKHPGAMWMKTAAHQLAKWVPTSSEFRRQQLRDVAVVQDESAARRASTQPIQPMPAFHPDLAPGERIDESTGEIVRDVVDAEIVDEPPAA